MIIEMVYLLKNLKSSLIIFCVIIGLCAASESTVIDLELIGPQGELFVDDEVEIGRQSQLNYQFFHGEERLSGGVVFLAPLITGTRIEVPEWSLPEEVLRGEVQLTDLKLTARFSIVGSEAFPYFTRPLVEANIALGQEQTLRVPLRESPQLLPRESAEFQVRVISSITSQPLAGYPLRYRKVTDEHGLATFRPRNILDGVVVGNTARAYGERMEHHLTPGVIRSAARNNRPIELTTDKPQQVIQLVTSGVGAAPVVLPLSGWFRVMYQDPESGLNIQERLSFHRGVGARYESNTLPLQRSVLREMRADVQDFAGDHTVRAHFDRITLVKNDALTKIVIPVEPIDGRRISFSAINAHSGDPVPNAGIRLIQRTVDEGNETIFEGETDEQGRLETSTVPWTELKLESNADGFQPHAQSLNSVELGVVNLALRSVFDCSLTINNVEGRPLGDAVLTLWPDVGDGRTLTFRAKGELLSNGDVHYPFTGVTHGKGVVMILGSDGGSSTIKMKKSLNVEAAELNPVSYRASKAVIIEVIDDAGSSDQEDESQDGWFPIRIIAVDQRLAVPVGYTEEGSMTLEITWYHHPLAIVVQRLHADGRQQFSVIGSIDEIHDANKTQRFEGKFKDIPENHWLEGRFDFADSDLFYEVLQLHFDK